MTPGAGARTIGIMGGDHPSAGFIPEPSPGHPIWCPTSSSPHELVQSKPSQPTNHSFDARVLVGQSEARASRIAADWGCVLRVIELDGKKFILTMDYNANRIDVVVARGKVTKVSLG